jgi:hypothetical protein
MSQALGYQYPIEGIAMMKWEVEVLARVGKLDREDLDVELI